jgi:hypothetical protein
MTDFSTTLQGKPGLPCDVYAHVKSFRQKTLFETHNVNNLIHFPCSRIMELEHESPFQRDFSLIEFVI